MTATATRIVGAHPYADKFPMLSEPELAELAESIKANGQRNPIVLTPDGLILDGRNRYAACQIVGVDPLCETYDGDDLAEYVIDCNSSRRHMSAGSRAMANALVLAADGKRSNGRWSYGRLNSKDLGNSMAEYVRQCGVILDYADDLAEPVVSGALPLDAAYRQAQERRDAERQEMERKEREAAEEADAKAFVAENAPDLAARVDGRDLLTFREARALWEQRNREEATRLVAERRKREQEERLDRENEIQNANAIYGALLTLSGASAAEWRARAIHDMEKHFREIRPAARDLHDPKRIRAIARDIAIYADDLENAHA